jgi:hypothetical protein
MFERDVTCRALNVCARCQHLATAHGFQVAPELFVY